MARTPEPSSSTDRQLEIFTVANGCMPADIQRQHGGHRASPPRREIFGQNSRSGQMTDSAHGAGSVRTERSRPRVSRMRESNPINWASQAEKKKGIGPLRKKMASTFTKKPPKRWSRCLIIWRPPPAPPKGERMFLHKWPTAHWECRQTIISIFP